MSIYIELLNEISSFIKEVFNIILALDQWIYDIAYMIANLNVNNTVSYPLGIFRAIVGNELYLVFITSLYFGIVFFAIKVIKMLIDYVLTFKPKLF